MSKYHVVVCDPIHEQGIELLTQQADIQLTNASALPKEELLELISEADIAITRSPTAVNEPFLQAAVKLKALVRAGVGVDNIDMDGCSRRGIVVMNVPTANTIAAVELTMCHILCAARMLPAAHAQLKGERIWCREEWYGIELKEKRLGVIGFGNIGSRVSSRALAFGMDVWAYDPYIQPSVITDAGARRVETLEEILQCDIITIHTPKNSETTNIIGAAQIERMKRGVILINVARGGLYNEEALYEGLRSGKIRSAGLDVFVKEPATENRLLDLDRLFVTPHLGANTYESQQKIALSAAQCAIEAARGVSYPNALNLPIKEAEMPPFVKPYIELTQKLAFFASQANRGAIRTIRVSAEGEISRYVQSLSTYAVVGALRGSLGEGINYVNASYVATERGIGLECREVAHHSSYKNKVSVRIVTEKDTLEVGGTLFDENVQRIVDINSFAVDVEPKGRMLLFKNTDVPGVIGEVGSIFGRYRVNIADFRLGRDRHGHALAVILIDEDAPPSLLEEIRSLGACLGLSYAVL